MTDYLNCTNQQPPTYSGVTINITNPAMNIPPQYPQLPPEILYNSNYNPQYQQQNPYFAPPINPQNNSQYINKGSYLEPVSNSNRNLDESNNVSETKNTETSTDQSKELSSYPQQYYINNYAQNSEQTSNPKQVLHIKVEQSENSHENPNSNDESAESIISPNMNPQAENNIQNNESPKANPENIADNVPKNNAVDDTLTETDDSLDMTTSEEIIQELDERNAEEKELEKSGKKTKIVSLTNEYIMSLENYLNNPNTDIRLMAAKEILTRLDEDRNRYDDAALNALLNKMLQDPNKLVRIAALSAFSSELASGNDYTVQLLTQIQQNPEADPEDVLEASQILLKRTAITEVKYIPVPNQQNNNGET